MRYLTLIQLKEELVQFLAENNALKSFIREARKHYLEQNQGNTQEEKIISVINPLLCPFREKNFYRDEERIHSIIASAFIWNETNEGVMFWESLNQSWRQKTLDVKLIGQTKIYENNHI